jgi:hypothetical protein
VKNMIDAKEAARILGCCPDEVLVSRQRGLIRGYRYKSRLWRFRRADVDRLAEEMRASAAEPPGRSKPARMAATACVYAGPDQSHAYLGLVQKGTAIHVVEESNGWCSFFLEESGTKAWVQRSYTSRQDGSR